jgi:SAM-dependent methyltransferase
MKPIALRISKKLGLKLNIRPSVEGSAQIMGSYPPYSELNIVGKRESYFIHEGYTHRDTPAYFNDAIYLDDWQDEVYRFAREVADQHELRSVVDIGCGSAYKLLKYFHDRVTLGVDVEETCTRLQKRSPDRQWAISDFSSDNTPRADLVIASDVIEHLPNPDFLLQYIGWIAPKYVVISTPDRNLYRNGTHHGPPSNPTHLREWNMAEFHAYLSEFMEIAEHFISRPAQTTQCALGKPYPLAIKS